VFLPNRRPELVRAVDGGESRLGVVLKYVADLKEHAWKPECCRTAEVGSAHCVSGLHASAQNGSPKEVGMVPPTDADIGGTYFEDTLRKAAYAATLDVIRRPDACADIRPDVSARH
jgi:hypothetical protein